MDPSQQAADQPDRYQAMPTRQHARYGKELDVARTHPAHDIERQEASKRNGTAQQDITPVVSQRPDRPACHEHDRQHQSCGDEPVRHAPRAKVVCDGDECE